MREVDQALARAYAQATPPRGDAGRTAVPPAPHVPLGPAGAGKPDPAGDPPGWEWPALVRTLDASYGERFDRLAEAVLAARERGDARALLVTSARRAEGRTTLVLTLARALARRPVRTALVDADLTGPMLARQLGVRPVWGLSEVVEDGRALADALVVSEADRLALLPLRAAAGHPRGLLASPAWTLVLNRLRREFDLVLLDGGPLLPTLGRPLIPPAVDAALLAHSRTLTDDRTLRRARQALDEAGLPLLGLAETFVPQ